MGLMKWGLAGMDFVDGMDVMDGMDRVEGSSLRGGERWSRSLPGMEGTGG